MNGQSQTVSQRAFAKLIAETVAPPFKAAGFKKQGQNFRMHAPHAWMVFNIQKSQWGDRDEISFTANLGVRFDRIHGVDHPHDRHGRDKPPTESQCHWRERIGSLMNPPHDHWWAIIDDRTAERVAGELSPLLKLSIERLQLVAADPDRAASWPGMRYSG